GRSKYLPMQRSGIDDATDIFHCLIFKYFHMTGRGINGNMCGMAAITVGMLRVGKTQLDFNGVLCEFGKCEAVTLARYCAFRNLDLFRLASKSYSRLLLDLLQHFNAGIMDSRTAHDRGAGMKGAETLLHQRRRSMAYRNTVH